MSFDSLPNEVLLRIFGYLPLKDRVRSSGVNRKFKDISQKLIIDQKDFSFSDDLTTYFATSLPISSYLQNAAQNLKRINLVVDSDIRMNLTKSILEFACYPELIEISIVRKPGRWGPVVQFDPNLELHRFGRMIIESRRLKIIKLENCRFRFRDDSNGVTESLEILDVGKTSSDHLNSLVNRVPNLKSFTAEITSVDIAHLGAFLRSAPKLESLKLVLDSSNITDFVVIILALKSIAVKQRNATELLNVFPDRFPNLETLRLKVDGISVRTICNAAKRLTNLTKLHIFGYPTLGPTHDASNEFKELSACKKLRELILADFVVNDETLINLVLRCPDLRKIGVFTIATPNLHQAADAIGFAICLQIYKIGTWRSFESSPELQFKSEEAIEFLKTPWYTAEDCCPRGVGILYKELEDDFE